MTVEELLCYGSYSGRCDSLGPVEPAGAASASGRDDAGGLELAQMLPINFKLIHGCF